MCAGHETEGLGPWPVDQPAALDLLVFQGEFSGETGTNPVCKKSQVEGLRPVVLSASTWTQCWHEARCVLVSECLGVRVIMFW